MRKSVKRITAFMLTMLMLLSILAVALVTASAETSGDYEYKLLSDGTAEISRYNGSETNVTIPSQLGGHTVTSIGKYGFYYCDKLESVTLTNSINNIDIWAFYQCKKLKEIKVPSGNRYFADIDGVLFNKSLTEIIRYPEGIENTKYSIPKGVTNIAENTFYNCKYLESITLPNSLTNIGPYAFAYSGITGITIPNSVTNIEEHAFYYCINLESVVIPDSVTYINSSIFRCCSNLKSVEIPDSVTGIDDYAFYVCRKLTSVTIPSSVTQIGKYAFASCSDLENITVPDSVMGIGENAFNDTKWFENQPNGVVYAGKVAYKYKGDMPANSYISLLSNTTAVADSAFADCTNLKGIEIGDHIKYIGYKSFYGCTNLQNVTIGKNVNRIWYDAFANCNRLKSVTIPGLVTEIKSRAFGYIYDENKKPVKIDDFTIYGYKNTEAETYANQNGFKFIPLNKILGDADSDGEMNIKDATQIQLYLANFISESEIDLFVSDVDGDGEINIKDATRIQMMLAKMV